ncbi:unnamed protein product, partial [Closterium sp. NIES-53]
GFYDAAATSLPLKTSLLTSQSVTIGVALTEPPPFPSHPPPSSVSHFIPRFSPPQCPFPFDYGDVGGVVAEGAKPGGIGAGGDDSGGGRGAGVEAPPVEETAASRNGDDGVVGAGLGARVGDGVSTGSGGARTGCGDTGAEGATTGG